MSPTRRIAIAGGSDSIGKAIVEALDSEDSYNYTVLSRKCSKDPKAVLVDYSDIRALQHVLEADEIDTVISAVSIQSDAGGQAQMNLIEAAERAHCTKRFIPSEFGAKYNKEHLAALPAYAWKFKAVDRLESSNLEYTQFSNGFFMDYFFSSHIRSAFKVNIPCWIDLENNFAAIPGDGNARMVVTHSRDVGRFLVAVLGMPKWRKRYYLAGDRLSLNEFLRIAEEIKGAKFETHFDDISTLEGGKCTMLPAAKASVPAEFDITDFMRLVAAMGARMARGDQDLPIEGEVNSMFPHLETLTIQEAIQTSYPT